MRPAPSASGPLSSMSQSPPAAPPAGMPLTSPWHSPVPYLFGGLAAMLGLIAVALLILACSYWKLNSYLGSTGDTESSGSGAAADGEGSKSPAVAHTASPASFAGLVAVVMAGEKTPTFLAAPIVHRVLDDGTSGTAAAAREGSTTENDNAKAGAADSGGAVVDNADRAC